MYWYFSKTKTIIIKFYMYDFFPIFNELCTLIEFVTIGYFFHNFYSFLDSTNILSGRLAKKSRTKTLKNGKYVEKIGLHLNSTFQQLS